MGAFCGPAGGVVVRGEPTVGFGRVLGGLPDFGIFASVIPGFGPRSGGTVAMDGGVVAGVADGDDAGVEAGCCLVWFVVVPGQFRDLRE